MILGALLVLSQTRGVLPAAAASGLVVLLFVPGRPRRVWALAAIGLGARGDFRAAARRLPRAARGPAGRPGAGEGRRSPRAARCRARRAGLGGRAGGARAPGARRTGRRGVVRRGEARARRRLRWSWRWLAAVAVVGDPVDKVRQQYDDFVNLRTDSPGDTRFLSGGGYRYDYWRVAWLEFEDEPLRGQGAGNYDASTSPSGARPRTSASRTACRCRRWRSSGWWAALLLLALRGRRARRALEAVPPGRGSPRPAGSWPSPPGGRSWRGSPTRAWTGCTTSRG